MMQALAVSLASGGLSTGEIFAAFVTIFCFLLVPLIVWILKSLINEAKRRTADSLNLASIAKSNSDLNDNFKAYAEKNDAKVNHIDARVAVVEQDVAVLQVTQNGFRGRKQSNDRSE